ncbi:MAG: F0F1 ATP synthase subunit B [Puniceicoccales bacterium]|jgi:F-type H+-transporting ATPase subunit b|nr:F0F1 ATP synthase subunit B [Puniceicoccales bacterium]
MTHFFADLASPAGESSGFMHLMDTFGVRGDLLFAQVVNFCVVTYLLYRFALKPVLKTVEERQRKISEGLQYAEEMKAQLASAEQDRLKVVKQSQEDAQKLLERTKKESEIYLHEQKEATEGKINQMFSQARDSIEMERKQMITEARAEVVDLVIATTERILQSSLTDEVKASLNKQALEALKEEKF